MIRTAREAAETALTLGPSPEHAHLRWGRKGPPSFGQNRSQAEDINENALANLLDFDDLEAEETPESLMRARVCSCRPLGLAHARAAGAPREEVP